MQRDATLEARNLKVRFKDDLVTYQLLNSNFEAQGKVARETENKKGVHYHKDKVTTCSQ
jgi:hypothetical protein